MSELLKNITSHPSRDLVDHWARQGRLSVKSISGALLPPWLTRFIENLEDDARRTFAFDDHYVIAPLLNEWTGGNRWEDGKQLPEGFSYRSDTNDQWLGPDEIRELVAAP